MSEIMSFEEFTDKVKDTLVSHLPPEFSGATVDIQRRRKVNGEPTALMVIPEGHENKLTPCIYLNRSYENYKQNGQFEDVLERIADTVKESYRDIDKVPYADNPIDNMDKSKVFMQLINTESNKELLAYTPHRDFNDMSLIYRILYHIDDDGMQSVVITDDLAETMGVDEQELFELASVQTKELLPPKIQSMSSVMRGFIMDAGGSEVTDEMMEELGFDDEIGMYLVSNEYFVQGATNMVYDDVLYDVSGRLGEDVYVLPSSIHEFLVVPASMGDPESLAQMVTDINRDSVVEADRLSNQVFYYDREKRELTQVSDTPIRGIKDNDFITIPDSVIKGTPAVAMAR